MEKITGHTSLSEQSVLEITLLCSNKKMRVLGLARFFFNRFLQMIGIFKQSCQFVALTVAQGRANTNAIRFYESLGFQHVQHPTVSLMIKPLLSHRPVEKQRPVKIPRTSPKKRTEKAAKK